MPAQTPPENEPLSPEAQAAVEKALAQAETDKQAAIQSAIENERAQRQNPPPSFAPAPPVPGGPQQQAVQIMSQDGPKEDHPHVHDETVAGGLFMVRGKMVNCNGLQVNEEGQRVMPDGKTLMSAEDVMRESMELQAAQMQAVVTNIAK